jgi:glycine/D-amino acid oxidase-like deaminating enzyme
VNERCDVLVIGGGIMGAATAFELASRGIDTILVDRGEFGRGDTAKTAGVVRMNYSNPEVVRMALRGLETFRSFTQRVGGPEVFTQCGYIFLVPPDAVDKARENAAMQRSEGVVTDEVDPAAIAGLLPGAVSDGVAALYHEPLSGYADAVAAVNGYVAAAARLGARTWPGIAVERIRVVSGRATGAITSAGEIDARTVILAAGAWSSALAATCGVEVPIEFSLEQELIVAADPATAPRTCVSNMIEATYLRPFPSVATPPGTVGALLGRGFPKTYDPVEPGHVPAEVLPEFEADLRERIAARQPALRDAPVVASRTAVYDITPDWHPILGPTRQLADLVLVTGGNGHGFKLAPAFGEMVAASLVGAPVGYASLDSFSLDRFEKGRLHVAAYGGNRA